MKRKEREVYPASQLGGKVKAILDVPVSPSTDLYRAARPQGHEAGCVRKRRSKTKTRKRKRVRRKRRRTLMNMNIQKGLGPQMDIIRKPAAVVGFIAMLCRIMLTQNRWGNAFH